MPPSLHTLAATTLPSLPLVPVGRVAGLAVAQLDLGGDWRFHPEPPDDFCTDDFDDDAWDTIPVPGEWEMQGFGVPRGGAAGYRRDFEPPADWLTGGRRVRLRFEAVHSACRVWVNGREAGSFTGVTLPFEFDVTALLRPGRNTLAALVTADSLADFLAFANTYADHSLGGIPRRVSLVAAAPVHLVDWTAVPSERADGAGWLLDVRGRVRNDGSAPTGPVRLHLRLHGASHFSAVEAGPLVPGEECDFAHRIEPSEVRAWDCEHPNLHLLQLDLEAGGAVCAHYSLRVGFRSLEVRGHELLLNGRPLKLRGINRHEIDPRGGRAGTAGLARADVELFRAANINFIRTCHYLPPVELLEACDELGVLVEVEAPLCWVGQHVHQEAWRGLDPLRPEFVAGVLHANLGAVLAHRNHPCVAFWSLGNESIWSGAFAAAHALVKALDPSRPTIFHNIEEHGGADLLNVHYPQPWDIPTLCVERRRPLLLGEHAHVQCYNRAEIAADAGVREDWGRAFEPVARMIFETPHLLGGAIWSGIDDTFVLPDGELRGYGPWGVIDAWRRPKPEYWHLKKACSPVRLETRSAPLPASGKSLRLRVWNRYDHTDLSELRIDWTLGAARGLARVHCPPRARSDLEIDLPAGAAVGQALHIVFHDPRGFVADEEVVALADSASAVAEPDPVSAWPRFAGVSATVPLTAAHTLDAGHWTIDTAPDGALVIRQGERVWLAAAPDLLLLPLEKARPGEDPRHYRRALTGRRLVARCAGRRVAQVETIAANGALGIRLQVIWREAAGELDLLLDAAGRLACEARVEVREPMDLRQGGLVFDLPAAFATLAWRRDGLWTSYPPDHPGRSEGSASAAGAGDVEPVGPPGCAWAAEAGPAGRRDFCASRPRVRWAELRAPDGASVRVKGGGRQTVRAWREEGRTLLLAADFHGGGSDGFFTNHHLAERRRLLPGERLTFSARLLLRPAT